MNIAILGYGKQGQAAYNYWKNGQNHITICDANEDLEVPEGAKSALGRAYLDNLHVYDMLIRTPILHPSQIVAANPDHPEVLTRVWSVTNEFFKVCPSKNIIGVTGTKGKGTTSTLITRILEAEGHTVHLGGNIGIPPLTMLQNNIKPNDWVVLELANFQLIDLKFSPPIGVCLMVVPEHLDWHADVQEYVAAKQQLFIHQTPEDIAIYYANSETSKQVVDVSEAQAIPYMQNPGAAIINDHVTIDGKQLCHVDELKLPGKHNWQNVCAAVTATWQVTQNTEAITSVLTTFTGMEHRLELIHEHNGIRYYDDSFGTTPETAIVAIQAFTQPKVVILGGSDKGSNYTELAKTVKNNAVRCVILIGDMSERIKQALDAEGYKDYVQGGQNMTEIVVQSRQNAMPGDIVLLSPACASFDMFKNYLDRAEQFKKAVQVLA